MCMLNKCILMYLLFLLFKTECIKLGLPVSFDIEFTKSYKVRLLSISKCKLPPEAFDKSVNIDYLITTRKVSRQTTLIKVNFTVPKKVGPLRFGLKGYQLQQNSVKDLLYKFDNLKCDHVLPQQLIKVLKMKMDDNCAALPASYEIDNINVDDYANLISASVISAGKYAYDIEIGTPRGMLVCSSVICDMSLKSQNKGK